MLQSSLFRRTLYAALFALALSAIPPAQAATAGDAGLIAQDIASAGRLRMQSQRLAKLYQQAAMGMVAPVAFRQIGEAGLEIDAELARLARYARKPNVQRVHGRCQEVWLELRTTLKGNPSRAATERVNQLADELMIHTGKLAMLIEAEAETPVGRLLDLSSRLNMLSQRLARLYLLAQSGDKSQGVLIDIEQARKEFSIGLQELDTARENTSASREAIALAKNQWIFFELAISQLNQGNRGDGRAAQHVATSSERIAQVLDEASAQYARDYSGSLRVAR
ncbi:MAG: type IV pili methyl-accepting chemotaxis transducer N-terminal domain-containing protein [Dechloromonas sp.]|nr:type IV pili methyl-accepting chemotaxis transducer N-terminal domain-containing protein [Dechloromonas sp.]